MGKNYRNNDIVPTMNLEDTIKLNGYTYRLTQCEPCDNKCNNCIFGCDGHCCLLDNNNTLRNRADDLTSNCAHFAWGVYKLVKHGRGNSSTGGERPSNDAPSKQKILSGDTIRNINIQITLNEAREMYFSYNSTLKDLACRAFTPAEIEDVRKCTANIDLKTAKRLYHNCENAVRDFILSAFSKEELED